MKINKQELLTALEIVKPGLANNEMVEQATDFAFVGNRVVTYNDSISLSHPIPGLEIEGAIRPEELYGFLKRTKKDELSIIASDNELQMKAGASRVGLTFKTEVKLPLFDAEKDWQDISDDFCADLKFCKDCASRDLSRRVLTCVHVAPSYMESSDSYQVMRVYSGEGKEREFLTESILIPAENIDEILKINPNQIAISADWVHFRNAANTELNCRLLMDAYPPADHLFQVKGSKIAFPKKMNETLDRVAIFTKTDISMDEDMEVRLEKGKLTVHGKNDFGWFEEDVVVKYKGNPESFWISPQTLQGILKRSSIGVIGSDKIKFTGEGWEYIAALKGK